MRMTRTKRTTGWIGLLLAAAIGMGTLTACSKSEEGPAEKAGKALDEAAADTRDAAEEAKKDLEDAFKE